MIFAEPPRRIVLLHLDSLCCLPALDHLFGALGTRIGLVVSSDRFAGRAGFWRQLVRNLSRSGLAMTLALGFDIVALRIASLFAPLLRGLGRVEPLHTVCEHARRVGATSVVAADVNGADCLAALRLFKPDLVVSFHFDQILRSPFLEAASVPVINLHPALLPAHRGPCPSFWTLAAGDTTCGVTIHRIVDETIDTGEPILRWERLLPGDLCVAQLDEALFCEGARAVVALLSDEPADARPWTPGISGNYQSFPDRLAVRAARRRGVRLWRLRHAVALLMGLFGWRRTQPMRLGNVGVRSG